MEKVFLLWHCTDLDDLEKECKLIGVFSCKEKVTEAIDSLKKKEGFKDYSLKHFITEEYQINKINWSEGFTREYF